ncbi:MAG: hypothetical protein ACRDOO_25205 [Actinomadura sp.]
MVPLTEDFAARLAQWATRRCADGSRGRRARWAWRLLVRGCAEGDDAVQDAVREVAAELPEADVLELLAVGPQEPADRVAYLALIGQGAQRQALDPDGSLLALAYRAAAAEVRKRLRTALAAEGDAEVIRVVVTGEQRDRIAELSDAELDYLGRQLAEHQRWDELRRLALDLPLAGAISAARLLPADQRTGAAGTLLAALAGHSPERLRATVARLPRQKVITQGWGRAPVSVSPARASFSPDQTELAVDIGDAGSPSTPLITIGITTGESTLCASERRDRSGVGRAVVHVGDEIVWLKDRGHGLPGDAISRVHPVHEVIPPGGPKLMSNMARASTGAVAVTASGLVFIDRGSVRRRHLPVPRLAEAVEASVDPSGHHGCRVVTLPDARLVAVSTGDRVLVLDEQGTVLAEERLGRAEREARRVTFLTPDSLAVAAADRSWEVWTLSASGGVRRSAGKGSGWAGLEASLRGFPLDSEFATWLGRDDHDMFYGGDPPPGKDTTRWLVTVSTYADMIVTVDGWHSGDTGWLQVRSPYLSTAGEVLKSPLLHATPRHWQRVRELLARIGDPEVREVLALSEACLAHRFEAEIELGSGPVPAAGPADIALGADRGE